MLQNMDIDILSPQLYTYVRSSFLLFTGGMDCTHKPTEREI